MRQLQLFQPMTLLVFCARRFSAPITDQEGHKHEEGEEKLRWRCIFQINFSIIYPTCKNLSPETPKQIGPASVIPVRHFHRKTPNCVEALAQRGAVTEISAVHPERQPRALGPSRRNVPVLRCLEKAPPRSSSDTYTTWERQKRAELGWERRERGIKNGLRGNLVSEL